MTTRRASDRRVSWRSVILACMLAFPAWAAQAASDYPTKPVRIVVPYTPGGALDLLGRLFAQKLGETWGQQFVVDNRPGAGGNIGAALVAKAAPDGHTVMISTHSPLTTNQTLYRGLDYTWRDFELVAVIADGLVSIVANPKLPVKALGDLAAYASRKTGGVTVGSSGNGTVGHFALTELRKAGGVAITHVPYKGGVPAVVAASTGEVDLAFTDVGAAAPFIRDGRVRALAVTGKRRSNTVPEVQTTAEAGFPSMDVIAWIGLFVPKGTPRDIVLKVNGEMRRLLKDPQIRQRVIDAGLEPLEGGVPDELAAHLGAEAQRWQQRAQETGLKLE